MLSMLLSGDLNAESRRVNVTFHDSLIAHAEAGCLLIQSAALLTDIRTRKFHWRDRESLIQF